MREGSFGVHRLWEELKERFAWAEFTHSCGLGVLIKGKAGPLDLPALREEWRGHYSG